MLVDLLGARGIIDMGVNRGATVEEAVLIADEGEGIVWDC